MSRFIKSRTGCLNCKQRKIKCDEALPSCNKCIEKQLRCPGYSKPLKWSRKYETYQPLAGSGRRRHAWFVEAAELQAATAAFITQPLASTRSGSTSAATMEIVSDDVNGEASTTLLPPSSQSNDHGSTHSEAMSTTSDSAMGFGPQTPGHVVPGLESPFEEETWMPWPDSDIPYYDECGQRSSVQEQCPVDTICWSGSRNTSMNLDGSLLDATSPGSLNSFTNVSTFNVDFDFNIPTNPVLLNSKDRQTDLIRHYFSEVCVINSCFESADDPLRVDMAVMITDSNLLYHTIISMAAAHLAHRTSEASSMRDEGLRQQSRALWALQKEIDKLHHGDALTVRHDGSPSLATFSSAAKVLLGVIFLGISSPWHSASSLGTMHLAGARILMKSYLETELRSFQQAPWNALSDRIPSLLLGMMAYWEALAAFVSDQDPTATEYLEPFSKVDNLPLSCYDAPRMIPNPWTGIGTPAMIMLAKVGSLVRRKCLLSQMLRTLHISSHSEGARIGARVVSDLHDEASELKRRLHDYSVPASSSIVDTHDSRTPVHHLQAMARIYRLSGILELYRTFPQLARADTQAERGTTISENSAFDLVFDIAVTILNMISAIPRSSGVKIMQLIPLIVATSALGPATSISSIHEDASPARTEVLTNDESLRYELAQVARGPGVVQRWRMFVRGRVGDLSGFVGLPSVSQGLKLIDELCLRMDMEYALNPSTRFLGSSVHWINVMAELKLESMFG